MGEELSLWDRFKIAITPKSHAEAVVDEIYGPEGRGLIPVPETYDSTEAETPVKIVELKQAITGRIDRATAAISKAASDVKGSFVKVGLAVFLAAAVLIAINAFLRR